MKSPRQRKYANETGNGMYKAEEPIFHQMQCRSQSNPLQVLGHEYVVYVQEKKSRTERVTQ